MIYFIAIIDYMLGAKMNHAAITGWVVAIAAILSGVLYIGHLNGKLNAIESQLNNTVNRVDGLYIYVAKQGGSVTKAVESSGINQLLKDDIINSFQRHNFKLNTTRNPDR